MQLELNAGNLRFIFEKQLDRWGHRVVLSHGEQEDIPLFRSIEGDGDQVWPPSPPLQDPSHHELPGGGAVLAVGMAGTSHWSASFSIEEHDQGERQGKSVLAELACFSKKDPPPSAAVLVSSYQIEPGVEVVERCEPSAEGSLILAVGQHRVSVEPIAGDGWGACWNHVDDRWVIAARELGGLTGGSTRWGYRIAMSK